MSTIFPQILNSSAHFNSIFADTPVPPTHPPPPPPPHSQTFKNGTTPDLLTRSEFFKGIAFRHNTPLDEPSGSDLPVDRFSEPEGGWVVMLSLGEQRDIETQLNDNLLGSYLS